MKKTCSFILLLIFVAACGPAPVAATNTPLPSMTATLLPDSTPTATLAPSETPTANPTATATATVTPTPLPDLSGVSLYALGDLGNGLMLVTLAGLSPMDVTGLQITVNDAAYACEQLAPHPDRLYCTGRVFTPGTSVLVEVRLGARLLWVGGMTVPVATANPPSAGGGNGGGNP